MRDSDSQQVIYSFENVVQLRRKTTCNKADLFYDEADYKKLHALAVKNFGAHLTEILAYAFTPRTLTFLYKPTQHEGLQARGQGPLAAMTHAYSAYHTDKYWSLNKFWNPTQPTCAVSLENLVQAIRFVHLEPVRMGLCDSPDGWQHSSYHFYAGGVNDELLTPCPKHIGESARAQFIEPEDLSAKELIDRPEQKQISNSLWKRQPVGSEEFTKNLKERYRVYHP